MGTVLKLKPKLSPRDHGRPVTDEGLTLNEFVPGYKYEVIEGRLYVSPEANMPEDWVTGWIHRHLFLYSLARPDVINYLSLKARIFVPMRRRGETIPEPDVAAYLLRDAPLS